MSNLEAPGLIVCFADHQQAHTANYYYILLEYLTLNGMPSPPLPVAFTNSAHFIINFLSLSSFKIVYTPFVDVL